MPKSYRTCEIVQQIEYLTEEQIEKGLDHNAVKDYAYILHDKDENKDGELKKPHWHICIRFKDSVPTESICNWFGITEPQMRLISISLIVPARMLFLHLRKECWCILQ